MKIAFYIDSINQGGAQRVLCNLANWFAENGEEVQLITDYPEEINKPTFDVNDSVQRVYLQERYRKNQLSKNVRRVVCLRSFLKKQKAEVIVSFLGHPNYRMLIATFGMNVKKVISVRSDPSVEYGKGMINQFIANGLFLLADICIFQTTQAMQYFDKRIQAKSCVILNPIGKDFYNDRKNDCQYQHLIVATGNLRLVKNHKLLIDAFASIVNDYPLEKLVIYGEGECRKDLEEQIRSLNLESKVFLPGSSKDIQGVLKRAGVYVLSSNIEGLPNGLMEAMAMGVPCIATDCPCGGARQLLGENECGMLVPCGDKEALSNALRRMISDENMRKTYSDKARERAEEFRDFRVMAQWEKILKLKEG